LGSVQEKSTPPKHARTGSYFGLSRPVTIEHATNLLLDVLSKKPITRA